MEISIDTLSNILPLVILVAFLVLLIAVLLSFGIALFRWIFPRTNGDEIIFGTKIDYEQDPFETEEPPFQPQKQTHNPGGIFVPKNGRTHGSVLDQTQPTQVLKHLHNPTVFQGKREENPNATNWITGKPLDDQKK